MRGNTCIKGARVTIHRGFRGIRVSLRFFRRHRVSVIVAVTLVVAGELVVRAAAPRYTDRISTYTERLTGGHPIEMNVDGYRGERVRTEKPPGVYRVIALGDSVTFGHGVATGDAWPRRLERALDARDRVDAQVINAGLPRLGLRQMRARLVEQWVDYEPDAIVVMLTGHAVALTWIRRDTAVEQPRNPYADPGPRPVGVRALLARASNAHKRSALLRFLKVNIERLTYWVGVNDHRVSPAAPYGALLAHGWRQGGLDPRIAREAWALTEENLRSLVEAARARGIDVYVSFAPLRFTLTDRVVDNLKNVPKERLTIDPSMMVSRICEEIGVPFVPVDGALRAHAGGGPLYLLSDDTHFNARGTRVIAERIAEAITPTVE